MGCASQPQVVIGPYRNASFSECPACHINPSCPVDASCGRPHGCADVELGLPLYHNRTIVQQPVDLDSLSKHYITQTEAFVKAATASGDPFLLYYAFSHVHVPQNTAPEFLPCKRGPFGAALMEMDSEVGAVVETLVELDQLDNTLILVTGDNGPWECKCDLSGSAGPYKGLWQKTEGGGGSTGKMTVWEGGHRTVGLAHWPARIKPRVSASLTSSLDYFPTIANIAGAAVPADRVYDGVDLASVFAGDDSAGHNHLFHPLSGACGSGPIGAARIGQYKAVLFTGGAKECTLPEQKPHNAPCTRRELNPLLFDLNADPAESVPLTNETLKQQFLMLIAEKEVNINTTFRSVTNYKSSPTGRIPAVCCNSSNYACACV